MHFPPARVCEVLVVVHDYGAAVNVVVDRLSVQGAGHPARVVLHQLVLIITILPNLPQKSEWG